MARQDGNSKAHIYEKRKRKFSREALDGPDRIDAAGKFNFCMQQSGAPVGRAKPGIAECTPSDLPDDSQFTLARSHLPARRCAPRGDRRERRCGPANQLAAASVRVAVTMEAKPETLRFAMCSYRDTGRHLAAMAET